MTCISYETHNVNTVSVLSETCCDDDYVDNFSYFDYVFGVVNGVYDLKYYCMVIWDDQGGIVTYFKNLSYPHIDPMKQDQTYKP